MRKRLVGTEGTAQAGKLDAGLKGDWLDLDALAVVELTSEDEHSPIEHALGDTAATSWRASTTGPQVIRLLFDPPVDIHRIYLRFVDQATERSQEFSVHAQSPGGELRQVVRQQFTFSPGGSNEEVEDYAVDLSRIAQFELRIDPDRAHNPADSRAYATLTSLRLA
jgi:hypothetical protein